jgi:hypothetical protein
MDTMLMDDHSLKAVDEKRLGVINAPINRLSPLVLPDPPHVIQLTRISGIRAKCHKYVLFKIRLSNPPLKSTSNTRPDPSFPDPRHFHSSDRLYRPLAEYLLLTDEVPM